MAAGLRPSPSSGLTMHLPALSPEAFVADVLEATLGARHVLVGADFCYGKSRSGTVTTLLGAGARNGFAVTVVPPILIGGERVSSTQIRGLVADGDLPPRVICWAIRLSCRERSDAASSLAGRWAIRRLIRSRPSRASFCPATASMPPTPISPTAERPRRRQRRHEPDDGQRRRAQSGGVPDGRLRRRRVRPAFIAGFPRKVGDEAKFDSLDALKTQMGRDVAGIAASLPLG